MAQGLTPTSSHELRELNLARTILILSVVLIHSSPIARMQPQHVGQVGEDIQIIQPHEVEKIKIQPNRDLLTLLTCHPYASGGKQRYVAVCERLQD